MQHKKQHAAGFTLIEILLVVAILAILAGIVIVAVNPARQLAQANNSQRRADVTTILNAVYQFAIDNNGALPSGINTTNQVLGTAATGCNTTCGAAVTEVACLDLSGDLTPTYIVGTPVDPSNGSAANTDYYITQTASGRVTVAACDPQLGATISVTR